MKSQVAWGIGFIIVGLLLALKIRYWSLVLLGLGIALIVFKDREERLEEVRD